jgi:endonuclease/exonuclease/phosphatase family metal-dependent hydrolase
MNPSQTLAVLRDEVWQPGAEALVFQEADAEAAPHTGVLNTAQVEAITGLTHVRAARSTPQSHGCLGVVTFLHPAIEVEEVHLLSLPGLCPRGAVIIDVVRQDQKLRLIATHLALSQALRVVQMRMIGQHVARCDPRPLILCGDLNEWRPWGGLAFSRWVTGLALTGPRRASFPTRFPLLPLDRILTSDPGHVEGLRVLDGPGIRAASDHRPIVARVFPRTQRGSLDQ